MAGFKAQERSIAGGSIPAPFIPSGYSAAENTNGTQSWGAAAGGDAMRKDGIFYLRDLMDWECPECIGNFWAPVTIVMGGQFAFVCCPLLQKQV